VRGSFSGSDVCCTSGRSGAGARHALLVGLLAFTLVIAGIAVISTIAEGMGSNAVAEGVETAVGVGGVLVLFAAFALGLPVLGLGLGRRLRPGGWLFAAAISRYASLVDGLRGPVFDDEAFARIVDRDLSDGQHRNDTSCAPCKSAGIGNCEYGARHQARCQQELWNMAPLNMENP